MSCQPCGDHGLIRLNYQDAPELYARGDDAPDGFAVCLCRVGQQWRIANNNGKPCIPLWQLWAIRNGVEPERVRLLEDVLTPTDLAGLGFQPTQTPPPLDAIAAAARARGRRR